MIVGVFVGGVFGGVEVSFGDRGAVRVGGGVGVKDGEETGVAVASATAGEVEVGTAMAVDAVVPGRAGSGETLHAISMLNNESSNKCLVDMTRLTTMQRTHVIVK